MASINVAHRTKAEKRAVEKKEDPDKPDGGDHHGDSNLGVIDGADNHTATTLVTFGEAVVLILVIKRWCVLVCV